MKHFVMQSAPIAASALILAGCQPSEAERIARHTATIDRFCTDCHNDIEREADMTLEGADLAHVAENPALWEKVIVKLRGNLMPPPGRPRPEGRDADAFVAYLETRLDAAAALDPEPGPAPIHRLNRAEYGNAIRDLLALEIDPAELLPADDEAYGFDNIADVLRVSPSLLEQYLSAASKIAALAVGDPSTPLVTRVYRAPPDLAQREHIEGLPLGTRGGMRFRHNFPLDAEYDFNVFLLRNIVGYMKGLEWPHELEISVDGERVFHAQVGGEADNAMSDANFSAAADAIDRRLRTRVFVTAGPHDVVVAFVRKSAAETHEPLELHTRDLDLQNMNGVPLLDYVNVTGPYEPRGRGATPSRERIFTCRPASEADELPCAEKILSTLARRAYRRPATEEDIGLLLRFFESGRARGDFDAGIQNALRVMLANPAFLYRSEPDPDGVAPGSVYPVDDLALASRLSFFLWSSLPDEELLGLAERHELSDPAVYEAQVRRMLADPRSHALVENFAGQWLFLRNLRSARPGVEEFPNFDENLRRSMRRETELFFESIIREDRNVMDLLTADYTFVNERLARHYGIPGIYGSHFRRIHVPNDARRGLLGQGSILTITSYPNRTSPVLRGKWIMVNVLGTPPPAPPPNVPALDENEPGGVARSVRQRLQDHRENPVCASCHDILDPLGLALENFDAVGRWRTVEPGGEIDASGRLADGTLVNGPSELREALSAEPEQFVGVLVEKLLTYALGRGLEPYDMPAVRKIVRDAEDDDYRFSSLILGITNCTPFRLRRAAREPSPAGPEPGVTTAAR
ncbi:MAG TPA: DUF1592 domain-containing protein [Gammaproteobacteria bacterium]